MLQRGDPLNVAIRHGIPLFQHPLLPSEYRNASKCTAVGRVSSGRGGSVGSGRWTWLRRMTLPGPATLLGPHLGPRLGRVYIVTAAPHPPVSLGSARGNHLQAHQDE